MATVRGPLLPERLFRGFQRPAAGSSRHAQSHTCRENRKTATGKIQAVIAKLEAMELKKAAEKLRDGARETLSYYDFPSQHWRSIKTNNPTKRIMREIRRYPDMDRLNEMETVDMMG